MKIAKRDIAWIVIGLPLLLGWIMFPEIGGPLVSWAFAVFFIGFVVATIVHVLFLDSHK